MRGLWNLRIRIGRGRVEFPLIRPRGDDLGDNTQIITKEQRSKGRKHADEELENLGLHGGCLELDMQTD